jgi:hypothetical protein
MDMRTPAAERNTFTAGMLVLAGLKASAVVAAVSGSQAQIHTHCTTDGTWVPSRGW